MVRENITIFAMSNGFRMNIDAAAVAKVKLLYRRHNKRNKNETILEENQA